MKKILSTFMLLLVIFSNFFYYSFADNEELLDSSEFDFNDKQNEEMMVDNLDAPLSSLSESYNNEMNEDIKDNSEINAILDIDETNLVVSEEIEQDEEFTDNSDSSVISQSMLLYTEGQSEVDIENSKQEENEVNSNENLEKALDDEDKGEENYSCNECSICYDINQNPDEDFCDFCIYECDDDTGVAQTWGELEDDLPNLIISEVFFGGQNEWLEIYNAGDDFEGEITISGASSQPKDFNISIASENVIILKDKNATMIIDEDTVINSNASFTISDSNPMNIFLIFSGEILDTFTGDTNFANSNTSFHRIITTNEIIITTSGYVTNVTDNYLANPGQVFLQEIEPTIPEEPELTGDTQKAPNLKITEIYFDGDDNWFEITNIGDENFSGDLTLNGSLNLNISIEIPVGVSKVFANNLTMFESENNIELIEDNILFGIGEVNLNLIRSGEILDTFFVHESRVSYSIGGESSFEKVGTGNKRTTTYVGLSDRRFNINRGIVANPTKYFTTGENLIDVTIEKTDYNSLELPVDCDTKQSGIEISEVYFGNSTYPAYIEILQKNDILEDYIYLFVTGSALEESVFFELDQDDLDSKFILLSNSNVWSNEGRNSTYDNTMKLNDSGRIVVYGVYSEDRDEDVDFTFSEELLDVIYVEKSSAGNSVYQSSNHVQCAYIFDTIKKFSPGLTRGQSQFIQITPDPIIQYVHVGGGGGSCSNNETPKFNNSTISSSEIQISAIKYYGNKQILKLKNKTNFDINLREYYLQFLDGSTKNVQGNTLFAKSTMSFVGNYGLQTNQDFCVNLMKDGDVIDRYCRNSLTKANLQDEENIINQLTFWENLNSEEGDEEEIIDDEPEILSTTGNINQNLFQTNLIKIIDIDYDPAGADGDNESVTLLLLTGNYVDLSGYNFYYTKDGKTQKAKDKIHGILSYGIRQTFKGGFAFPNSTEDKQPVTVNLIGPDKKIVDTYIYNPNTEIPVGNYEVVSVVDGDTIKINYDSQETTIRFAGIDAPESSALRCGKVECFGPEAKQYLKTLIEGKTIYFEQTTTDDHKRAVGYIYLNGENINETMIKNGYAREYSYKNQSYKYQSQFKSAQDYARSNSLGLRGSKCKGERLCPVDETQMEYKFIFNIENVIYNPDGNDNGNEEIRIKMLNGVTTEFGTDFYLLVNDTKKSLKKYGSISPLETKKLVGTFGFPNNKLTTVSFVHNGEILDTYIYNPELDKLVDTGSMLSTGDELLAKIKQFQILSILPNPFGADGSNEEIELFCKSELPNLNLSSGFYLQIGTTKKYLKGEISTNESVNLKGAFSFPNKGGCVELGYNGFIFDKFCYTQPDEGQKFQISNGVIESISTLDLSILKNSKLQNIGNKVCLTYAGQKFACKNMPYSKLSTKKISQNKLYKNFFDDFEGYLKDNWKIMYYDSEIKNYFELLDEVEDVISNGGSTITVEGVTYDISQFHEMYESRYKKTPSRTFSDALKSLISDEIINKYESLKSEYLEILENK